MKVACFISQSVPDSVSNGQSPGTSTSYSLPLQRYVDSVDWISNSRSMTETLFLQYHCISLKQSWLKCWNHKWKPVSNLDYRRGFLIQPIGKYQLLLAWCTYPPSFHCKTLALLCLCRITVGISNMVDFKWNSLKAVSNVADIPLVLMWSKVRRSWWGCGCCQTKVKNTTQVS